MDRTTETLFLRMDPVLVRAVKDLAKSKDMAISELAEDVLRSYVSDSIDANRRAKLLQATEQALLSRVEERFRRLAPNVQGLYAKEALDVALAVELLKQVAAMGLRDERQLASVIQNARQEAHRRVSSRSTWSGPIPPEVKAELNKTKEEKAKLQEENQQLRHWLSQAQGRCEAYSKGQEELRSELGVARQSEGRVKAETVRTRDRYEWAIQQYEAQGMLKRKSLREFLADYDRR